MPVTATLYKQTGFSPINVCANLDVLKGMDSVKTVALDLITVWGLTSVRVKAFEKDIASVDYLILHTDADQYFDAWDVAYSVTDKSPVAMDTWELSIVPDSIATIGLRGFDPVAGMVSRSTQIYCGADENVLDSGLGYTKRAFWSFKPVTQGADVNYDPEDFVELCACTIDLKTFRESTVESYNSGVLYSTDAAGNVVLPIKANRIQTPTTIKIHVPRNNLGDQTKYKDYIKIDTGYYALYTLTDLVIQSMNRLHRWGYENTILAVYKIPAVYLETVSADDFGRVVEIITTRSTPIIAKPAQYEPKRYYADHSREYYSRYADIILKSPDYQTGLISVCTGSSISRRASEIGSIYTVVDPRPDGCPYFVMDRPDGFDVLPDTGESFGDFLAPFAQGAVKGVGWERVPVVYTGASGRDAEYRSFYTRQIRENDVAEYKALRAAEDLAMNAVAGGVSAFGSFQQGHEGSWNLVRKEDWGMDNVYTPGTQTGLTSGGGLLSAGVNAIMAPFRAKNAQRDIQMQRMNAMHAEYEAYVGKNLLVPPTVASAPAESLVQITGNFGLAFAAFPQLSDLDRMKQYVTMMGASCSRFWDNRETYIPSEQPGTQPFVFVKIDGASIVPSKGSGMQNVPDFVWRDIENALSIGVRIWYTRPKNIGSAGFADFKILFPEV